jgi:EAL domain-containing protein (putative c-di-GMP-specific phosphodiesterase class I)
VTDPATTAAVLGDLERLGVQVAIDDLRQEQCDAGQGFLFSRPLSVDAARAFLAHAVQATAAAR